MKIICITVVILRIEYNLVMYCSHCGAYLEVGVYCHNCGTPIYNDVQNTQGNNNYQNSGYQNVYNHNINYQNNNNPNANYQNYNQYITNPNESYGLGLAAFLLAIAGSCFIGLTLGIVAIKSKNSSKTGKKLGIIAIVVSIVIILLFLFLFLYLYSGHGRYTYY